jgi:hypothetical protein
VNASAHLRGIVIAGGLAALALALGFVTLAMNQTASRAAVHTVLTLKARRAAAEHGSTTTVKPKHVKPKPVDQNFLAALQAGLPRSVAKALEKSPVAVVELTSKQDPVAKLAFGEAQAGAAAAGASFVSVDIDQDGGAVEVLTRLLGDLPVAPAALVYVRPSTLSITLPGFNDSATVHQAIADAAAGVPGAGALANGSNWASQADGLCTKMSGTIRATSATTVSFETAAGYVQTFLKKLKALEPPAGKAALVNELNVQLRSNVKAAMIGAFASVLKNAHYVAVAKAASVKSGAQVKTLSLKLGTPSCAGLAS